MSDTDDWLILGDEESDWEMLPDSAEVVLWEDEIVPLLKNRELPAQSAVSDSQPIPIALSPASMHLLDPSPEVESGRPISPPPFIPPIAKKRKLVVHRGDLPEPPQPIPRSYKLSPIQERLVLLSQTPSVKLPLPSVFNKRGTRSSGNRKFRSIIPEHSDQIQGGDWNGNGKEESKEIQREKRRSSYLYAPNWDVKEMNNVPFPYYRKNQNANRNRPSVKFNESIKVRNSSAKPKSTSPEGELIDCAICLDTIVEAAMLPCGHIFCYTCIEKWLNQSHWCPICQTYIFRNIFYKTVLTRDYAVDAQVESNWSKLSTETKDRIAAARITRLANLKSEKYTIMPRIHRHFETICIYFQSKGFFRGLTLLAGIYCCRRFKFPLRIKMSFRGLATALSLVMIGCLFCGSGSCYSFGTLLNPVFEFIGYMMYCISKYTKWGQIMQSGTETAAATACNWEEMVSGYCSIKQVQN